MKKGKDDVMFNFFHVLLAVLLKELLCFEADHPKNRENIRPLLRLTRSQTH